MGADTSELRVIAIDGPAGAGKSTVGRALAAPPRSVYLDTGAMFRAVTVAALRRPSTSTPPTAVAVADLVRGVASTWAIPW